MIDGAGGEFRQRRIPWLQSSEHPSNTEDNRVLSGEQQRFHIVHFSLKRSLTARDEFVMNRYVGTLAWPQSLLQARPSAPVGNDGWSGRAPALRLSAQELI
jgi:hypothetical protein